MAVDSLICKFLFRVLKGMFDLLDEVLGFVEIAIIGCPSTLEVAEGFFAEDFLVETPFIGVFFPILSIF